MEFVGSKIIGESIVLAYPVFLARIVIQLAIKASLALTANSSAQIIVYRTIAILLQVL